MRPPAEGNATLSQYLLGQLTPERQSPLEERLLTEAAFHEELTIAEDELIDRYLAGDLAPAERQSFEAHFLLAPERRRKLRFARTLRRYVAAESGHTQEEAAASDERASDAPPLAPRKPNFLKLLFSRPALAFSVAALLLVATVSWIVVSRRAAQTPLNVYAVTLTPGITRDSGGGMTRITIPPDVGALRLRLEFPKDDYPAYRTELQTAESRTIHTADGLKSDDVGGRRVIAVDVPVGILSAGDYQLRLYGLNPRGDAEAISRHYFRLTDR